MCLDAAQSTCCCIASVTILFTKFSTLSLRRKSLVSFRQVKYHLIHIFKCCRSSLNTDSKFIRKCYNNKSYVTTGCKIEIDIFKWVLSVNCLRQCSFSHIDRGRYCTLWQVLYFTKVMSRRTANYGHHITNLTLTEQMQHLIAMRFRTDFVSFSESATFTSSKETCKISCISALCV